MRVDVDAIKTRASSVFAEFTTGQKAMLGLAALAVVVGGYTFMQWAAQPDLVPLYSNLEPEDASDVIAELDASGIAYELADGGRTIKVADADVYQTRLAMSAAGVPSVGAPGYDLLDEQGLTTSQFKQRVDFQRAMEGELARTIAAIEAVDSATVHLVMPEDDLFSNDDVHASASVLVHTRGDKALTSQQVQAVVHLVASSVEGLTPEFVTVADATGRVLSSPGGEGLDAAAGEQQVAQKLAYESAVARSIETLLLPVTGAGKSRVVVSADLDFDERASVSESFGEPDTAPVVSEDVSTETYTGGGPSVGGVLGPEGLPVEDGGEGTEYEREDTTRTYAVDKVTEEVRSSPGSVRRLSIAVLVDETAGIDTASVAQLVTAGAGLQPDRGDSIEVSAMAFGTVETPADAEGTSSDSGDSMVSDLLRSGAVVLFVLLVLLLAYRSAKKSSLAKYPLAIPLPADDDEDDDNVLALEAALQEFDASEAGQALSLSAAPAQHLALQNHIGEMIDKQPEDVAAVLRTWLADRR